MLNKKVLYSACAFLTLLIGYVYIDKFHPNLFNKEVESKTEPMEQESLNEVPELEESLQKDSNEQIEEKPAPKVEEKDEFPKREKAPERQKRIHRKSQISKRTVS